MNFNDAAEQLDQAEEEATGRVIDSDEFVDTVEKVLTAYLTDGEDPTDDTAFLMAYAIAVSERVGASPHVADRTVSDRVGTLVELLQCAPVFQQQFEMEIEAIIESPAKGPNAALYAMCAEGRKVHPTLAWSGAESCRVIRVALQRDDVPALVAAVDARESRWAQLGWNYEVAELAYDFLGLMAGHSSGVGDHARAALIELCRHPATAVQAALRLPVTRMTRAEISELADLAERHADWASEGADTSVPGRAQLMPAKTLRTVAWLASDACWRSDLHRQWNYSLR